MAFGSKENVRTYTAEGAGIVRGVFVIFGSSDNQVSLCGAGGDMIGIAQNDAAAGEPCEVARPGDGAEMLLAATLARGVYVKSDAAGKAVAAGTARTGAMLVESGVANDIVGCEVVSFEQA